MNTAIIFLAIAVIILIVSNYYQGKYIRSVSKTIDLVAAIATTNSAAITEILKQVDKEKVMEKIQAETKMVTEMINEL